MGSRQSRSLRPQTRNNDRHSNANSSSQSSPIQAGASIEAVEMLGGADLNLDQLRSNTRSEPNTDDAEIQELTIQGPVAVAQHQSTGTVTMTSHSAEGSSARADARGDIVDDLRQQVLGKDELIAALVAELEQVVEQLDRVKRNGGDRSRTGAAPASLPAEVVEEHQQVLGELQRVVQQWEEMQAATTLGRIEAELAELRSLVAGGYRASHAGAAGSDAVDLEGVLSRLSSETASGSVPAVDAGSNWESMKRQMLGEPEAPMAGASVDATEHELSHLLDGLVAPTPVDFDSASLDALKGACAERDTYIVQVTRWIRTSRTVAVPENWDEIQGVPEELARRVEQLSSRLEEQVRLAEVEMSLERARLSREKSHLQAERAVMEKHLKRLGIATLDELEDIAVSSSSSGDRRWMRFLGVNRKS